MPAQPAARVGVGDATPEQIVNRDHEGRVAGLERGERGRVDHVVPGPSPHQPVVPCPGQQWSRQARDPQGMAERGKRIVAVASARRTARRQGEVRGDPGAESGQALEEAEDIGADASRCSSAQLFGEEEQTEPAHHRPRRSETPARASW